MCLVCSAHETHSSAVRAQLRQSMCSALTASSLCTCTAAEDARSVSVSCAVDFAQFDLNIQLCSLPLATADFKTLATPFGFAVQPCVKTTEVIPGASFTTGRLFSAAVRTTISACNTTRDGSVSIGSSLSYGVQIFVGFEACVRDGSSSQVTALVQTPYIFTRLHMYLYGTELVCRRSIAVPRRLCTELCW